MSLLLTTLPQLSKDQFKKDALRVDFNRNLAEWLKRLVANINSGGTGPPGESAYVYIAYASSDDGNDFTMTFDEDLDYIAVLTTTTEIATPVVADFAGLWKNYKGAPGEDGEDGQDGEDGEDGDSAYLYIAYASDDDGTGFTLTFDAALDYIAILTTTIAITTPVAADFTGLWKKYKGEDGAPADLTHYCYVAWRDAPGDGFTLTPNLLRAWEAILITHTPIASPVEADFNGLWRPRLAQANIHEVPAGGAKDQVLKKNSGDDYDASWQDEAGSGGVGASKFIALTDTPATYTGKDKNIPVVDEAGEKLEFAEIEEADEVEVEELEVQQGMSIDLADMPQALTGKAGYILVVKADESGYELIAP